MKLYKHQINALNQTTDQNHVAYYLDMGLGKTFVGAEKMLCLGADTNLLICQKSKIQDWIDHFEAHYPKSVVCNLTKKGAVDEFISRFNAWHGWHGASFTVGIINYELAWRRKDLLQLKDFTLMLDESSLIQNRKAKQTKFILKLQPKNVILLSGTPCSGKYENLWTQAHLLGWDISESLFNRQYINWETIFVSGGMRHKIVDRKNPYKNIERLKTKFRDHGAVFMTTEECFDLPEQNFIEVKIPKSKDYKKFMRESIIEVDDTELVGDTRLTKRLYARQLCGQYNKAKFEAFEDLVQSTNDRLIVFYNFNDECSKLTAICEKMNKPISIINGQVKDLSAYETQNDSITFVQYQAGAMGLNLQKANKIIYFTLPERSELFEQSKKRIHRIGQLKPCMYYIMSCKDSIEEDIYLTLQQRKDYTDELFNERK